MKGSDGRWDIKSLIECLGMQEEVVILDPVQRIVLNPLYKFFYYSDVTVQPPLQIENLPKNAHK